MDVWVTDNEGRECPTRPVRGRLGEELQGNEEWEHPDLGDQADKEALVDPLRQPGPKEELDDKEDICRDLMIVSLCVAGVVQVAYSEQIGFESTEAKRT